MGAAGIAGGVEDGSLVLGTHGSELVRAAAVRRARWSHRSAGEMKKVSLGPGFIHSEVKSAHFFVFI